MADDEKQVDATSPRGTDWEVVSLTASAYAAAPGPEELFPPDERKDAKLNQNDPKTHDAIFMSQHFVFPPKKHENLPIEYEDGEIQNEFGGEDGRQSKEVSDGTKKNEEENWKTKSDDSLHGFGLFDKGNNLSIHDMEFSDGKPLQGLGLVGEGVLFDAPSFTVFSGERDERPNDVEPLDSSDQNIDFPSDSANASKSNEENKCVGLSLPCDAWWKRRAAYFYKHAKEANTFWSIFIAAAVMGFVVLGQQWQRENLQLQQLKWQFSINEERMHLMLGPIARLKDALVGGHQRASMIRGAAR